MGTRPGIEDRSLLSMGRTKTEGPGDENGVKINK